MARGVVTNPNIKEIIINRAKAGDRIDELAKEFKLYPNTIRKWLATEGVSGVTTTGRNQRSTVLLLAKAEREKQDLLRIIGKLTVELTQSGSKKKGINSERIYSDLNSCILSKRNTVRNTVRNTITHLITVLPDIPRTRICTAMGVNRSNTYRVSATDQKDTVLVERINEIRINNPFCGLRRVRPALQLHYDVDVGINRLRRVSHTYNLSPKAYSRVLYIPPRDRGLTPTRIPNLIHNLEINSPNHVWCTDFTYLQFQGYTYYLSTLIDIYTKE
jgi:hypothetical protein